MRPRTYAAIVLLILMVFVIIVLMTHEWNPKTFILETPEDIPPEQTWGVGYDGRFAYAIALNPGVISQKLDNPEYRYMRIIYPIAAYLLAFGRSELVPWSLVLINVIAVSLSAAVLAALVESRGGRTWVVLPVMLSFSYLTAVRMDLNEPLAYLFCLAGLWFYERERVVPAWLLFALGGLTKEVTLVFPLTIAIVAVMRRNWTDAVLLGIGTIGPYLGWALVVNNWLGVSPFATYKAHPILIPFAGLGLLEDMASKTVALLWSVAPAAAGAVAALVSILRKPPVETTRDGLLLIANAAVVATLPAATWIDPLAVLRMGMGVMLTLVLWLSTMRPSWSVLPAVLWGPTLLLAFLIPGYLW